MPGKRKAKDEDWDRFFDALIGGMASGAIKNVEIRMRACPKCHVGDLNSNPSPNWMNRWTCNKCGKHFSR